MARKPNKIDTPGLWPDALLSGAGGAPAQPARQEASHSRRWTPPQLEGITTVGCNLLVSAAAGSGKTAMLSERCAHLICDADPSDRCDVDELLVVTFTEKAAAEMKTRIVAALRDRAAAAPSDRLRRQLALAEQAQVSTLHAFCARMLRQHFNLLGLDPGFTVMDGEEAGLLQLEVARKLFHDRYESDDAGDFQALLDCYSDGDDEQLLRQVIRAHDLLGSLVSPDEWLRESRRKLAEAADAGLASELGGELIDMIGRRLAGLRDRCAATLDLVVRLGHFDAYVVQLRDLQRLVEHWEKRLVEEGIDVLGQEVNEIKLPALPRVAADTPGKDPAKSAIEAIRKDVTSGAWRDVLRFSPADWQDGMRRMLPHAEVFLGLVEHFGSIYASRKRASRQLDFSDLEQFALKLLLDRDVSAGPELPASDRRREMAGRPRRAQSSRARPASDRDRLAPSPTARLYHRHFKHVLVDEYQDINELQDAIISLLSHEHLPPRNAAGLRPNLFCVGDVKQSIYGFRLAEPGRFLERESLYRGLGGQGRAGGNAEGKVIDLQANFRSRGPLLQAINGVFRRLMTRAAADIDYTGPHELTAGLSFPDAACLPCFSGSPIELHLLPEKPGDSDAQGSDDAVPGGDADLERTEREAVFMARRISQILGLDGSAPTYVMNPAARLAGDAPSPSHSLRPARFRDIVILLRSMRHKAEQIADVLRLFGIPTHSQSITGYFESVEVRDMLALLAVLDNQRQDIPLAALLRSPLAELPEPEDALARIRLRYPARQKPVPFHQAVLDYAREMEDNLAGRLRALLARLASWRLMVQRRPLAEAVWAFYQQSGYLAFVSGLVGGEQRVANLLHLHERAEKFGTFQRQGLRRFLDYLEKIRAESDLGEPSIAGEAEDVVRIMSIHRSKGLEFPIVFLPDLGKKINLNDCEGPMLIDRHAGLGMTAVDLERQVRYPSLASTLVAERLRRQAMAEELRVLYVAMTRAREHLILAGTCREGSDEKWRGRWSDHAGPLPAETVVGARSMLDWLGPVAACPARDGEIICVTTHGAAETSSWALPSADRHGVSPRLATTARLTPLAPPPLPHPSADAAIARLSFRYPFQAMAELAAVRPMTEVDGDYASSVTTRPCGPAAKRGTAHSHFAFPAFYSSDGRGASSDSGIATHLLLEQLDFSRPLDADDVAAQLETLLSKRMLDPALASRIDRDAVAWFADTEIGRLLRRNSKWLLRELPVHYLAPDGDASAPQASPLDRVMVRGRLDGFLPLPEGGLIVDYKTDNITADQVADRAERYRGQLEQYRAAMQRITGKPVNRTCLVFLTARVVWELPDA